MKILSTRAHGVIDYVMSFLVMGSPWVFGFARGGAETWVPIILGAMGLTYSVFTNYELGVMRSLSMRTHLMLDYALAALLAVSPWLFGFASEVYVPHLVMGILAIGAAAITNPVPATSYRQEDHRMNSPRAHSIR